jgi:hypothetical protein
MRKAREDRAEESELTSKGIVCRPHEGRALRLLAAMRARRRRSRREEGSEAGEERHFFAGGEGREAEGTAREASWGEA